MLRTTYILHAHTAAHLKLTQPNRASTHRLTMSFAARLDRISKLGTTTETSEEMSRFTKQTLAEMGQTKVDFGEAHLGQTYDHVWENHKSWLKFILNKYAESPKMSHRKLIHFTQMKIERTELEQGIPEQLPVKPKVLRATPKPKPMAQPVENFEIPPIPLTEDEEEAESFIEIDYVNHQNQVNEENIQALQSRMLHMEGAITEILGHLRNQP